MFGEERENYSKEKEKSCGWTNFGHF